MEFEDILREYNIPFRIAGQHHHARENWINISCPFCNPGGSGFHMGYSIQGKYTHCWRCGGHRLVQTFMEMLGERYNVCIKLVEGVDVSHPKKLEIRRKLKLPKHIGPLLPAHRKYLKKRRFNPSLLEEIWGIQGIGIAVELAWRIFIPIKYKNQTVSWTTRALKDGGARYVSAPSGSESIAHKSLLYGEDYANHAIIVCEGPFDVWRIGPGAVATFGVNYSPAQVRRISKYPVRTILFDNEKLAQKRAYELSNLLSVFPGVTNNATLDAKDAGEADEEEIKMLRKTLL